MQASEREYLSTNEILNGAGRQLRRMAEFNLTPGEPAMSRSAHDEPLSLDDATRPVSRATVEAAAIMSANARSLSPDDITAAVRSGVLQAAAIIAGIVIGLFVLVGFFRVIT